MSSRSKQVKDEELELSQHLSAIATSTTEMHNYLEQDKFQNAFDVAYEIIEHLRISTLSPKLYYVLFLEVQTQLTLLTSTLVSNGNSLLKYYEKVQYYSHAVPRLYLMCAVGSACVTMKKASVTDILKDMVEMCRSVQNPTKGLFLRNFLLDIVKNRLPDVSSDDNNDGTIQDSINFLLTNFTEMNKLNLRLPTKEKQSQLQLCQLVAKNIGILSNLEGLTTKQYKAEVLPQILQQLVLCGDVQTQSYLIDATIQTFPTKYQLVTLKPILRTIVTSQKGVDTIKLLSSILSKLTIYIDSVQTDSTEIYNLLNTTLIDLIKREKDQPHHYLSILPQYFDLLHKWYSTNETFEFIKDFIPILLKLLPQQLESNCYKGLIHFIQTPLLYFDVLVVIQLFGYLQLFDLLDLPSKRTAQTLLLERFIATNSILKTSDEVHLLMNATTTLHKDLDYATNEDIIKDSHLASKLVQTIQLEDEEELISLIREFKGIISLGHPVRQKISLPGLLFKLLQIKNKDRRVFVGALDILKALAKQNESLVCIRLSVMCGLAGSTCGFDTSNFFEYATSLFESSISSANERKCALQFIIGGLAALKTGDVEKYSVHATATTKYSQFIEDIPTRCMIIGQCSHLWSKKDCIESRSHCLACLQKALKEANGSSENVKLFVEVLNKYVAHYAQGFIELKKPIEQLVELVENNINSIDDRQTKLYFNNTKAYIKTLYV
ncbi:Vacuolar protein sorting 35 [Entamoeba marina]